MTVVTERIFRSDETPTLKLTARNIPSVTVRAYRVNVESYFRKMHLAGDVESLDIALIDPDRIFEYEIPGYAQYQQFEHSVEVPLPRDARSGAMAVTVSSDTLEATALVIQSDLDVIVKASRDEVLVFAENMLTGKPWPGARLLISDGSQVFAEAVTGDDGVLQKNYPQLRDTGDVRVVALAGGHMASNVLGLKGISVAQGLADKGYIYTDRPAYRAGQRVYVRGCIRRAAGDAYVVDEGKDFKLEVFDPRNRLVWQEDVVLGEFGSFHTQFPLPPTAPQGEYRVSVHRAVFGSRYQGTFQVHEYKLEPVRLAIEAPRRVHYRGEEIEGTIRAEYYYGAPLAGREITYQLADDRLHTATTDASGEVHFNLSTRDFSESQVLTMSATLSEWNVQNETNFFLSAQGFSIELSAVRETFVAGETFEIAATTKDAAGKAVGRKLTLKVFELPNVEGKVGERLVEEHIVETAEADGMARRTLKLENGGRYRLRAVGVDRFKNPVSGYAHVLVSDDEDKVRLRILANRYTFKAGDTAEVILHWREDPALALVTFQGARVLDYRLVELKKGVNKFPIVMTSNLAPNFELAVAVMTDTRLNDKGLKTADEPAIRLHEASCPFTVERDLNVSVSFRPKGETKGPVRPGDELEVTVTTTDSQGKPISSELSLAMVEQALLEQFSWPMPTIQDFFAAGLRQPAVRTTSSITFDYHPETQPIKPLLLTERQRAELAQQEAASLRKSFTPGFAGMGGGMGGMGGFGGGFGGPASVPSSAASSEFDTLIDLITKEIAPSIWEDVGGPGSVEAFPTKLSITVSQTQDVHEKIVEFLEKRRADSPLAKAVARDRMLDETGYWNPAVVTGENGKATIVITVPERTTAWILVAKGITSDTLAGETTNELVAKKELSGQLKLPSAFTAGDEAEVVATVHNNALAVGTIDVTLTTKIGDRRVEEKKSLKVTSKGIHELPFNVKLARPDEPAEDKGESAPATSDVVFQLTIEAGEEQDVVRRVVPLKPYGLTVFATAGGSTDANTTAWVEAPESVPFRSPSLQILVGPTIERSLLDIVLAAAPSCQRETLLISSEAESVTSDLMASLALQKLLGLSPDADGPQAQALDARIRTAISQLVSTQTNDGGWRWSGAGKKADRYVSARVVWSLSLAKRAGYVVPDENYVKSVRYLASEVGVMDNSDYESKAILLHALSVAGQGDFSLANRLYRERPSLSTGALLHLALSFAEMKRKEIAGELLTLVAQRDVDEEASLKQTHASSLPWTHSPAELRALYALAVQAVTPQSPKANELVDWLLAHRTGHRWSPDRATGPAALAASQWYSDSRFEGERYRLTIWVNDQQAKVLEMDSAASTQVIDVPASFLVDGKQRVRFDINGRGRYAYQVILAGFVPADSLKSTTDDWKVERIYQPAPLEREGREIPRGFGNIRGTVKPFRNPLTQLPVGRHGLVELKLQRDDASTTSNRPLEYLVVTEPIPSGAAVIEQSVRGAFERFEIVPGAIIFYIGNRRKLGNIHYELCGYLPGSFRTAPTVVRNVHRPDRLAVSQPKPLTVLTTSEQGSDPYRLSPQELYELGRLAFKGRDPKTAEKHLAELVTKWNLEPTAYRSVVEMLLDVNLELNNPGQVVRYFEIIYERWPDQRVPFAKVMKVGAAYHEMGEYERSYLVFRQTIQSNFTLESGVAGFLASHNEFLRSVDVMERLLREYPPESYVAAAHYALAQQMHAKAPESKDDPKLREQKINRVDLILRAWRMLEDFLTAYPEDPAADQAAFSAAGALLELERYSEAADACERYAQRYPKSDLLDSFWYIVGYSRFASGQHEAASDMLRKVADSKPIDKATGRPTESPNKWPAIYILGQIYHSLGKAADAIGQYRLVEDRYPDTKKSIQYFQRKAIRLPEVTTVRPGQPVKVSLDFRNIAACDVKVYRIDLMKFALLRQSLGGITTINLAGIEPQHASTVKLGDGRDYRDREHVLPLALKDEGAYLVVCRGDNLFASGLVLLTPLEVEVQHEPASREVRATVKDAVASRYLNGVHVKITGAGNADFVSGSTDRRGLFVAEGIVGAPTVIARAGAGRYAFHRAQSGLGATPVLPARLSVRPSGVGTRDSQTRPRHGRASTGVVVAGPGAGKAEQRIEAALNGPTVLVANETPLEDVIASLRDQHRIPIEIDTGALDDVGIGTDSPITRNLKGISLRSALRLMLKELELTYVICDEVLLITTPEEAESELATVVYPVRDLVRYCDAEGKQWADFDTLIDMITSSIAPQAWDTVGGPGSIEGMQYGDADVIVLSQTQDVHREIVSLLDKLRSVSGAKTRDGQPPLRERPEPHEDDPFGGGRYGGGGMGGYFGGPSPAGVQPASASGLLKGLHDTKRRLQGHQIDKLRRIYSNGMGGMGGGVGMGGMF